MLAIGLKWNGQTLNRTFIEINEENEISLAQFLRNFKEVPLLDSFSDFPLSIKVVIDEVVLIARLGLSRML